MTNKVKAAPDAVELTREEQLELENIQLKLGMLQRERADLDAQKSRWGKRVSDRIGADIKQYIIDLNGGTARRAVAKGDDHESVG